MKSNKYLIKKYNNTDFMFMQYCPNGRARFTTSKRRAKKYDCEEAIKETQKLNELEYNVFLEKIDVKT